jgi:hypothetical protein
MVQATLHFPPPIDCSPPQMKARRSLSMCFNAHYDSPIAIEVCTGTADNVALVSAILPATFNIFPFRRGILAAIASMSPCSTDLLSLYTDNGIPR